MRRYVSIMRRHRTINWLRQLENRDYISSLAGKLWQVASGKMSNSEE